MNMQFIKLFESFEHRDADILPKEYVDFVSYLKSHGIPTDQYGTGVHKTIGHLWNEIEEGETDLKLEDDQLVRRVQFVGARVIHKINGKWFRLHETKQVFKDGRVRKRAMMPYSMAEKFKMGEDPKEVIIRGMEEELNLTIGKDQFVFFNKVNIGDKNNDGSDMMVDYPGIVSHHIGYEFLVILNDEQYNDDGYIERQVDKDVYFGWKPVQNGIIKESFIFESMDGGRAHDSIDSYVARQSPFDFFIHDNMKLQLKLINNDSELRDLDDGDGFSLSATFQDKSGREHKLDFIMDDKFKIRDVETTY